MDETLLLVNSKGRQEPDGNSARYIYEIMSQERCTATTARKLNPKQCTATARKVPKVSVEISHQASYVRQVFSHIIVPRKLKGITSIVSCLVVVEGL